MKTDFLTYVCRSLTKQKGLNILAAIVIMSCIYRIEKLNAEVKAFRLEEGVSE